MVWFKIDDGFALHPKAIAAGNAALGLWVRAGSWCGAHLTDGRLPAGMVGTLGGHARDVRKLIAAGLWCQTEDGYAFIDWEQWQPTKAQVKAEREATRQRVQRWRDQSRNAVTDTVSNGVTNGVTNAAPTRPDPSRSGLGSQSLPARSADRNGDGPDLAKIANILGTDQRWAERVATQILERAPAGVRDRQRYVEAAIRERPADYRPTPTPPGLDRLCDEHGRERSTCPPAWHEGGGSDF
jgi:hypothetical protein